MPDVNAAGGFLEQIISAPKIACARARRSLLWRRRARCSCEVGFPAHRHRRRRRAVGLALRFALEGFLGTRVAYVTFYPVLTVAAIWGGSVRALSRRFFARAWPICGSFPCSHRRLGRAFHFPHQRGDHLGR